MMGGKMIGEEGGWVEARKRQFLGFNQNPTLMILPTIILPRHFSSLFFIPLSPIPLSHSLFLGCGFAQVGELWPGIPCGPSPDCVTVPFPGTNDGTVCPVPQQENDEMANTRTAIRRSVGLALLALGLAAGAEAGEGKFYAVGMGTAPDLITLPRAQRHQEGRRVCPLRRWRQGGVEGSHRQPGDLGLLPLLHPLHGR